MSDEANPQAAVLPPPAAEPASAPETVSDPEVKVMADTNGKVPNGAPEGGEEVAIPTVTDAPALAERKFSIDLPCSIHLRDIHYANSKFLASS
jgi:hypothetical protein